MMCEDRQVEVDASGVSCVSWDRVDARGQAEIGLRGSCFWKVVETILSTLVFFFF